MLESLKIVKIMDCVFYIISKLTFYPIKTRPYYYPNSRYSPQISNGISLQKIIILLQASRTPKK